MRPWSAFLESILWQFPSNFAFLFRIFTLESCLDVKQFSSVSSAIYHNKDNLISQFKDFY
jgi:hypothetical protein